MKEKLIQLGLSENEAKTYLELLRTQSVTTTILAKKLHLHRGYIYDVLDKLIEKGFVSVIKKNGKKHFEAVPPANILGYIEEQKKKLEDYEKDFKKTLPQLEAIKEKNMQKQRVMLFEGKNALKTILEDILIQGKTLLVFGATGRFPTEMESYYFLWNKRRAKKKITLKIIYNQREIGEKEITPEETLCVEKRYLEFDTKNPASTMIYGNKVIITIWTERPIITMIENEEVAKLYNKYFETFWNLSEKI